MPAHNNLAIFIILALAVVLELIALACGIIARRTVAGKAGMIISGSSLALCVLFAMYLSPSRDQTVHQSAVLDAMTSSSVPAPMVEGSHASSNVSSTASTQPLPFEVPGTPAVAPTLDELSHVLAELPAAFRAGLEGNTQQQISDLDTQVWAMNFERGPAYLWLETAETGQQTFPERLPADNPAIFWSIEHPKAHILMWLQPRWSAKMRDRLRKSLRDSREAPDYALGIDVDGKSLFRSANYPGFSQPKIPLWFNEWPGTSIQTENGAFQFATIASGVRAVLHIKACTSNSKDPRRVEFGLWYRPATRP